MNGIRGKAVLMRGAMLMGGLIFGLIASEIILRVFFAIAPAQEGAPYLADPHADYLRRPTRASEQLAHPDEFINSFGLRDREHAVKKEAGVFRVLGIGDSFVYSVVPLDENFLRVAEARMAELLPREFREPEMILMGMGAWSPENEVGALESFGRNLDADLVVLNFFVGNDVTDIPLKGKVIRGRLNYVGSPYPILNLLRKSRIYLLAERSLLYRLRDRLVNRHVDAKVETTSELIIPDRPDPEAILPNHFLHHQMKRLPVYEKNTQPRIEKLWKRAEEALDRFDRICREEELHWILHIIPAEIQVDEQVRGRVFKALGVKPSVYDFDLPQRRLRAFAADRGIPVVDPLPLMRRKHDPAEPLYIQFDSHWNRRGNAIAGVALADSIIAWMNKSAD